MTGSAAPLFHLALGETPKSSREVWLAPPFPHKSRVGTLQGPAYTKPPNRRESLAGLPLGPVFKTRVHSHSQARSPRGMRQPGNRTWRALLGRLSNRSPAEVGYARKRLCLPQSGLSLWQAQPAFPATLLTTTVILA